MNLITPQAAATAIPRCGECGANGVPVVVVGEPIDHESLTACLCRSCLHSALVLLILDGVESAPPLPPDELKAAIEAGRLADIERWRSMHS